MPKHIDAERRRQLETFYESLSPEERRERILLEPAFRDRYNELTTAHRVVQVPHYFWTKWVPVLGPLATTLYMQLRQYCYYNPRTGEKRDWCWPKQETLCQEIGVRDPKTLRKGLRVLEEYGFIRREKTYYVDPHSGKPHQGTNKYYVYFEIPLTASDAAELLLHEVGEGQDLSAPRYDGKKSSHREAPVEKPPYDGKISPHVAGENLPSKTNTRNSTSNVNVSKKATKLDETTNYMAEYLSEELSDPKSLGFYRRAASLLPERTLHRALSETKDAYHRGFIRTTRARFFTDLVKRYAKEQGVDLQLTSGSIDPELSLEG